MIGRENCSANSGSSSTLGRASGDLARLTASFRLLDVDDGQQTQNTGIGLDGGTAAPFLGLTLDF